jgi:predicted phage terminase large subunit-like protein
VEKDKKYIHSKLKDSMILFGKVIMSNMFSAASPWFHYEIAKVLTDNDKKQVNIIAPRGHAKSSIVGGVYPLYHIMNDSGAKLIVLVSRTQDHAIKLLGTIKDTLEYSESFRQIYGYWGQHSAKQWSKTEVELKDGSMIICKGTGQQLRGIKVGSQRPTLIIVDDPEDENNTKTAEAMEANLRWLLQSAVPSLDPQKGKIIVIGTPQHQRCLVEILKSMDGWVNMHFAPDLKENVALWEEWQPIAKLLQKKKELESIGRSSVFYREYMCQIVGDEDQLFQEKYIQYHNYKLKIDNDGRHFLYDDKKEIPVNVFMGVDPASSVRKTADYSVIMPIAVDENNNRYILQYYRQRATPMKLAESIIEYFKIFKPVKVRVESVGYQEMLREYLKQRCDEEKIFISGLEIKESPRTSKSSRLETMQPYFAQKKMFMLESMEELRDELLLYPRGKHDDLLDGLFYAMKKCYTPNHKVVAKENKNTYNLDNLDNISWKIA